MRKLLSKSNLLSQTRNPLRRNCQRPTRRHCPAWTFCRDCWMTRSPSSRRWLQLAPQQASLLLYPRSHRFHRPHSPPSSQAMLNSTHSCMTASSPMPTRWRSCSAAGIAIVSPNSPSRPRTCRTCRISCGTFCRSLAETAKDLQNVPQEMRHVIKLTVVALSPIELSIARDLTMRLEAPGFVGEALLVAKKMGYENYLTAY